MYVDIQGLAVDIVDTSCGTVSVMKTAVILITISIIVTVSDGCLAPPSSSSQDGIVTRLYHLHRNLHDIQATASAA